MGKKTDATSYKFKFLEVGHFMRSTIMRQPFLFCFDYMKN